MTFFVAQDSLSDMLVPSAVQCLALMVLIVFFNSGQKFQATGEYVACGSYASIVKALDFLVEPRRELCGFIVAFCKKLVKRIITRVKNDEN